jgi:hypothetical protein
MVNGLARGTDSCLYQWAKRRGIEIDPHKAQWERYGRAAGAVRNGQMVKVADVLVAFEGGSGTANCVKQALGRGVDVWRVGADGSIEVLDTHSPLG